LPRHYAKTISGTCGHAADEIHCPNDRQGANSCLLPYQLFIVQNRAAAMFASAQRTQGAWIGIAWLAPLILLMFVKKRIETYGYIRRKMSPMRHQNKEQKG
jgi:hypothetical protein